MSGIPSWARVGRKVVCVAGTDTLSVGQIYTITAVYPGTDKIGQWGVKVAESETTWGWLGYYSGARFRPAVEDSDENGIEAQFYHKRGLKSKAPVRESERA